VLELGVWWETLGRASEWANRDPLRDEVAESKLDRLEAPGIETRDSMQFAGFHVDSRTKDLARVDVSARSGVASGPSEPVAPSGVEDVLARAIAQASAAGRWDVVMQLARELEARRLSADGAFWGGSRKRDRR
jgi:hypothetical protein